MKLNRSIGYSVNCWKNMIQILIFLCTLIHVGCDFDHVLKQNYFIDKTFLIKTLITKAHCYPGSSNVLLICPKGSGKTVNLNMIKRFLERPHNNLQNQSNRDLFLDRGRKLNILKDVPFVQKHFGQYPIIYLNFSVQCEDDPMQSIRLTICRAYREYAWLYEGISSGKISMSFVGTDIHSRNGVIFEKICSVEKEIDQDDLDHSLHKLLWDLYSYYRERIVILADNFDAPIMAAKNAGRDTERIGAMMSTLFAYAVRNGYQYLQYTFIFGTLGVFAEPASCVKQLTFMVYPDIARYFGITDEEMIKITKKYDMQSSEIEQVRRYYDGYLAKSGDLKIYNVFSVSQYLNHRDNQIDLVNDGKYPLRGYWAEANSVNDLQICLRSDTLRQTLEQFMLDEAVTISLNPSFDSNNMAIITNISHSNNWTDIKEDHRNSYFSYLLALGYFSYRPIKTEQNVFKIPNMEIAIEIGSAFLEFYTGKKQHADTPQTKNIMQSLQHIANAINHQSELLNVKTNLEESLGEVYKQVYPATGKTLSGRNFHCIFYSLSIQTKFDYFKIISKDHWLQGTFSNSTTSVGRIDFVMFTHNHSALMVEMKVNSHLKDSFIRVQQYSPLTEWSSQQKTMYDKPQPNIELPIPPKQIRPIFINVSSENHTVDVTIGDVFVWSNNTGVSLWEPISTYHAAK